MTAAAEDNHSYYDKTVGATVGKTVGKTVGAIPTVGKIPTVGVVGVKTGVTAGKVGVVAGKVGVTAGNIGVKEGMKAASTSMKDTYVHLGGHVLRVPAGAVEQYNMQNEFTGYAMGGEFVNAADMIASASESHSYYDKTMTNVGVNAGQAAAATSIEDTYAHYGGHVFQVPAGAIE